MKEQSSIKKQKGYLKKSFLEKWRGLIFFLFGGLFSSFTSLAFPRLARAYTAYFDNPGQGIFQCHSDEKISEYLKGGGWAVSWRDLQPRSENELDSDKLQALIERLRTKKHYLHFIIYGTGAGSGGQNLPDWLGVYDTDPSNDKIGVVRDGQWGVFPQPWDSRYLAKLEKFLSLLAPALRQAGVLDKLEYLEPAAGGYWGTTHLWVSNDGKLGAWAVAAGCGATDWACLGRKYTEGVTKVLETYLRAFPEMAIMVIGGSCRYPACNFAGFNYLWDKYGMRVMTKEAGLGASAQGECGIRSYLGGICGGTVPKTKCGQEPWAPSGICSGNPALGFDASRGCGYYNTYMRSMREEKVSYYCLYSQEIGCLRTDDTVGKTIDQINREIAEKVGAQIWLTSSNLESRRKKAGEPLNLSLEFENRGSLPLVAALKQGEKWIPSSYKIFLEFVNERGEIKYYTELLPSVATNSWLPSQKYVVNLGVVLPVSLAGEGGQSVYKIYAGLTDPNGEKKRFALRNTEERNDSANRRYLLEDNFVIEGGGVEPCPAGVPGRNLGNADCNGSIDVNDFELWKEQFQSGIILIQSADFNSDNKVDGIDFEIWRRNAQGN